jgi:hypothetical protein
MLSRGLRNIFNYSGPQVERTSLYCYDLAEKVKEVHKEEEDEAYQSHQKTMRCGQYHGLSRKLCVLVFEHETLSLHFHHRDPMTRIESEIGTCESCQRFKLPGTGYGTIPPREAHLAPWQEIAVDLIGL